MAVCNGSIGVGKDAFQGWVPLVLKVQVRGNTGEGQQAGEGKTHRLQNIFAHPVGAHEPGQNKYHPPVAQDGRHEQQDHYSPFHDNHGVFLRKTSLSKSFKCV